MNIYTKSFILLIFIAFVACTHKDTPKYKQDKKGEVLAYFNDSVSPKVIWNYNEDSTTITASYFYQNGKLRMKGQILNGVRNGKWTAWDNQGRMLSTGNYIDGIENGMWTVWYPKGVKRYEGMFKDGKRTGIWKFYNEQGMLTKEIEY